MTQVKSGDTVQIHYTGSLTDGKTFDSSQGRDPLEFEVGSGQIIPGLDEALPGMSVGEKKTVNVPCEDAYGPVNPDMRQDVPRSGIPDDIPLERGSQLQMQTPEGQVLPVTVVPGVGHFFHGQLGLLKQLITGAWHRLPSSSGS